MKNRKVIVTAFLVLAIMLLGVGYAAVSDVLQFSGNATLSDGQVQHEFDVDVKITAVSEDGSTWIDYNPSGAEIERANDLVVGITGVGDDEQDIATFQIYNLTDAGEAEVIWFKVENDSIHDADLTGTTITETGLGDHFDSEYTIYKTDGVTETTVLPGRTDAGAGSVLVKLVITLKSTPSESYVADFAFSIRADDVDDAVDGE